MVWRVFLAAGADPGCLQAHIRLDSSPYCLCEPFSSLLAYPALQPHPSRPFLGDLFAWAAPWHPIPLLVAQWGVCWLLNCHACCPR